MLSFVALFKFICLKQASKSCQVGRELIHCIPKRKKTSSKTDVFTVEAFKKRINHNFCFKNSAKKPDLLLQKLSKNHRFIANQDIIPLFFATQSSQIRCNSFFKETHPVFCFRFASSPKLARLSWCATKENA